MLEVIGYPASNAPASQQVITGNGVIHLPKLEVSEIRIQELTIKSLMVCARTIPEIAHFGGLIGMNLLKQFRSISDGPNGIFEMS